MRCHISILRRGFQNKSQFKISKLRVFFLRYKKYIYYSWQRAHQWSVLSFVYCSVKMVLDMTLNCLLSSSESRWTIYLILHIHSMSQVWQLKYALATVSLCLSVVNIKSYICSILAWFPSLWITLYVKCCCFFVSEGR